MKYMWRPWKNYVVTIRFIPMLAKKSDEALFYCILAIESLPRVFFFIFIFEPLCIKCTTALFYKIELNIFLNIT